MRFTKRLSLMSKSSAKVLAPSSCPQRTKKHCSLGDGESHGNRQLFLSYLILAQFSSLSLHGIEGAFSGAGEKTVIPSKVIGKFSIRLVPNMKPEKVNKMVIDFLNDLWKKRGSPNTFNPRVGHDALPWVADTNDSNFKAGARAMKQVHGVDPDYIREGAADDMAHSQNEKINKVNYLQGVKTLLAYLLELGKA
ncbi:unnamed protein product [Strongylus vulgaris]|uniref:Peptidase M20 dimerisation domain-containing protein n=1 Tax=Strongylus vulgaris TaxID=40348 RepID=A0A3P7JEZ4_STRVU|nr:unnamed protein product [Strongylus vulgaris]